VASVVRVQETPLFYALRTASSFSYPECKLLQDRISLKRAAFLLQTIMYRTRKRASYSTYTSVEVDGPHTILGGYDPSHPMTDVLMPLAVVAGVAQDIVGAISVRHATFRATLLLHAFAKERLSSTPFYHFKQKYGKWTAVFGDL
jgi:hypothetical protein